ncbi:MAG TPA: permease-like cell division protein FtsX [Pseudonocardiaceae bacterium]|nr:permease-like cell division protein FtsX [Pseudonocardiaceae bacterium]
MRISTGTDAQMTQIAHAVVQDQGIKAVYTETQQQAFRKYQQEFADRPDLLAIARPEALPAAAVVVPVDGVDVHQLATGYRRRFTGAKSVEPFTQADSARKLAAIGVTAPPTPCPASGELPQPSSHR